ncbi:low affinity iron permease family protein [Planosporangium thailandense]|uniref:Low affinity iron permease family protein n=1 Tax=Planosporangium thailandense TaxID=765197 RepID=A0ABX0XUZ3_9ACTN|nr:low affinity iron permease family protein [Planosporangium thailandense]NJC69034.1 low affinity iron permease family protein [Planosporangium thailandense]
MGGKNDPRDDPRYGRGTPQDRGTRITRTISQATAAAGSFPMILLAVGLVVIWLIGGLFVHGGYTSTAYQLPVSTVSSIVTFVMVFVIQSSQNRDSRALQTKIDAIASVLAVMAREQGLSDHEYLLTRLAGLEEAPEHEIDREQELVRKSVEEVAQNGE